MHDGGMKNSLPPLTIAAVLLAFGCSPANADDKQDHEAARAALARHEILPLPRILAIAAQRLPGDVVKVELDREKGQFIYELKILGGDGQMREIEIDAKSGAVLKIERD